MTDLARNDDQRENGCAPAPASTVDRAGERSTLSSVTPAEETLMGVSLSAELDEIAPKLGEREAALARTEVAEAPIPPLLGAPTPLLEFPDDSRIQDRRERAFEPDETASPSGATTVPAPRISDAIGPLSTSDPTGSVLGGAFRIRAKLGRGAIGQVWLADDLKLGRPVAVKLVALDQLDELEAHRVSLEAHLTARIQHRNVVTVFDTGRQEQIFYLAMELLEGEDLGSYLSEHGSLPPEEAVRILLPALNGMAAAHARGVIHRDFKPENIFLVHDDGRLIPKVVDFGVALAADQPANTRLTHAGLLVGTPLYMAPEQLGSYGPLDERVDVWAATAVLYEMLTGAPPYAHEKTITELVARIASQDPVPLYPLPDEGLRLIIERGLQKNREDRWPSIRHLGVALAQWLSDQGVREDVSGESLSTNWLRDSFPHVEIPSSGSLWRIDTLTRHSRKWMHTKNNRKKVWIAAAVTVLVGAPSMFERVSAAFAGPSALQTEVAPVQDAQGAPAILAAHEDPIAAVPEAVLLKRDGERHRTAQETSPVPSKTDADPFFEGPDLPMKNDQPSRAVKSQRHAAPPTKSADAPIPSAPGASSGRGWSAPTAPDSIDPRWGF